MSGISPLFQLRSCPLAEGQGHSGNTAELGARVLAVNGVLLAVRGGHDDADVLDATGQVRFIPGGVLEKGRAPVVSLHGDASDEHGRGSYLRG